VICKGSWATNPDAHGCCTRLRRQAREPRGGHVHRLTRPLPTLRIIALMIQRESPFEGMQRDQHATPGGSSATERAVRGER